MLALSSETRGFGAVVVNVPVEAYLVTTAKLREKLALDGTTIGFVRCDPSIEKLINDR